MRPRPFAGVLLALLLGGCVYYNGMYNTNRLAHSARKAERDGRTFEATNLWGQVVTRAESVVVRHPKSKYADQASVLRGLALARLDQCPTAVGSLSRVTLLDRTDDLTEEAALALGRCQLQLGDPGLADLAFARVIDSRDSVRRREARFLRARTLRLTGRYPEALALMNESRDPRNREDLLLALVGSGQPDQAFVQADSMLASGDTAIRWDSVVVALGQQDPQTASRLVDRLDVVAPGAPEFRARRLYEDGLRLWSVDSARAVARFATAAAIPGHTESTSRARLRLLRLALAATRSTVELPPIEDSLAEIASRAGGSAGEAEALGATTTRLRTVADSAIPGTPQGDLRLFLAGETARDSLAAPALAAGLFRHVVYGWPDSPYAPKAMLAAQQLEPDENSAERLRSDSAWSGSPYLAMLRGEDAPGYAALEDSLAAFAAAQMSAAPRTRPTTVRRRPAEPAAPDLRPGRGQPEPAGETPARRRRALEP
jgi:hypothetical protein